MAPQPMASLVEQCHAFQDKASADIAGIETQLSKLSADHQEALVQADKHRAMTDLAITKLQDSVQLLLDHFRAGHVEPSSTSAMLSSSSTPLRTSSLLPNPPVDQKFTAVPYVMLHTSIGSMPLPHYSQHTTGPPPVTTQAPTLLPVLHAQYTPPPRHFDNDVIRHIKTTAPTFDHPGDPTMFLDWVQAMEDYFAWYDLTNAHKLRIGKMTLQGAARQYWNSVEEQLYQFGRSPMTLWDEMKSKLREQYLPVFYRHQLYDQLYTLSKGSLTITEFRTHFIEHKIRAGIREEPDITMSRFIHGLRDDIKCEVHRFRPHIMEDAYCHALEVETFVRPQRRYTGIPGTFPLLLQIVGLLAPHMALLVHLLLRYPATEKGPASSMLLTSNAIVALPRATSPPVVPIEL